MKQMLRQLFGLVWRWLPWLLARLALMWLVMVILLVGTVYVFGRIDRAQPADVIVVLGAGLRPDNRPGPALIRRTARAAELWQAGVAGHVICTGGVPYRATRSEADACGELLRSQGVPTAAILLEERSRSTEENALFAHEILRANGWQSAVVVSDGYHLLRATWLFGRQGIPNTTSPAPDPPFWNHFTFTWREVIALHWQVFKDVLNLPVTYVSII
jgi:uncharacterized SAM-binding protein YcdF (DUF218 family)